MEPLDVQSIVDRLGPTVVSATVGDASAVASSVVFLDRAYPAYLRPGTLALAVGYRQGEPEFAAVCAQAAAQQVAAVVVKGTDPPDPDAPLPLVVVNPDADWAQLSQLIRSASSGSDTEGFDLFEVAETLAALCGGPVVVHDAAWELLTYSSGQTDDTTRQQTILGRAAPSEPLRELAKLGYLARLEKGEVVHVGAADVEGLSERYAAGVTLGEQYLGSVWALPTDDVAEDDAILRLTRAVQVAQLPLLRHLTRQQSHDSASDLALQSLLRGGRTGQLVAEGLGATASTAYVLAALRPLSELPARRERESQRLLGVVRSYLEAYRTPAVATADGGTTYVLVVANAHRSNAIAAMADLQQRVRQANPHRAVIGTPFVGLAETGSARAVVDGVLELAERRDWPELVDVEAVQSTWRLEQFRALALTSPTLLEGPVQRLTESDAANGTRLVETLRVWFQVVGDVRAAAAQLHLHVNTVRFRLRKAEQLAGFSLEDPDDRLLLQLQLLLAAP